MPAATSSLSDGWHTGIWQDHTLISGEDTITTEGACPWQGEHVARFRVANGYLHEDTIVVTPPEPEDI